MKILSDSKGLTADKWVLSRGSLLCSSRRNNDLRVRLPELSDRLLHRLRRKFPAENVLQSDQA